MLKYELSVLLFTSLMNEHFPRGSTKISLIKSKEENRRIYINDFTIENFRI